LACRDLGPALFGGKRGQTAELTELDDLELTVGSTSEAGSKSRNRMEIVPWFRPPVETQFATTGSVGETTIVYVPSGFLTDWAMLRLVWSSQ
jgi:hypothetical protein